MFIKINVIDPKYPDARMTQTLRASSVVVVSDLTALPPEYAANCGGARSTIGIREDVGRPIYSTDHASQIETALLSAMDNERIDIADISTASEFDDPDLEPKTQVVFDIEARGARMFNPKPVTD